MGRFKIKMTHRVFTDRNMMQILYAHMGIPSAVRMSRTCRRLHFLAHQSERFTTWCAWASEFVEHARIGMFTPLLRLQAFELGKSGDEEFIEWVLDVDFKLFHTHVAEGAAYAGRWNITANAKIHSNIWVAMGAFKGGHLLQAQALVAKYSIDRSHLYMSIASGGYLALLKDKQNCLSKVHYYSMAQGAAAAGRIEILEWLMLTVQNDMRIESLRYLIITAAVDTNCVNVMRWLLERIGTNGIEDIALYCPSVDGGVDAFKMALDAGCTMRITAVLRSAVEMHLFATADALLTMSSESHIQTVMDIVSSVKACTIPALKWLMEKGAVLRINPHWVKSHFTSKTWAFMQQHAQ